MVAEAIASALPEGTPCVTVKEVPADLASYDVVFMGFWADQGNADKAAQAVIKEITNEKVALFCTLGVPPVSPQTPVGYFKCQGKVDPKVIEMMYKMFPEGHSHGKSAERDARHAQAASHPDENDLANAKAFASEVVKAI